MPSERRATQRWLIAAGILSLLAAALHIGCIVGGAPWYEFFGAGPRIVHEAEMGSPIPTIFAAGIATILAIWAAYAFSGAGLIGRLPLLKTGLVAISAIYLGRGLAPVPAILLSGQPLAPFWLWSSGIVLIYGVVHAIGTWKAWPSLRVR